MSQEFNNCFSTVFSKTKLIFLKIVHVVTAADGAEQYYTCLNNKARTESMEEALVLDRKTREVIIKIILF